MSKRLVLLSCSAALALACGMGPNDAEITSAVERNLSADVDLQGNAIDVASLNGEVTLMGSVDSPAERAHAQSVAEAVEGVKTVRNQLGVDTASAPGDAQTPPVAAPPPTEPAPGEGGTVPPTDPAAGAETPPLDTQAPTNTPTTDPRPQGSPADESTGS